MNYKKFKYNKGTVEKPSHYQALNLQLYSPLPNNKAWHYERRAGSREW